MSRSFFRREKARLRSSIKYLKNCMKGVPWFEENHWREKRIAQLQEELRRLNRIETK